MEAEIHVLIRFLCENRESQEVLGLAESLVPFDNDEVEAESQTTADTPTGTDEISVTIRTLNCTLYALLATPSTGRCLRLV